MHWLGHTIWFTGLSRSGLTTIAEALARDLRAAGRVVEILDGKLVRDELGAFFGYSRPERLKVSRLLCLIAKMLSRNGSIWVVTSITPYKESRDYNRRELARYLEIYVDCPLEICVQRDKEGLYKRAMNGDLK